MEPIISVIVPIYNVEKYIVECLESLVSQTQSHIEILLIDDGSTDTSGEIARRYARQYEHIQYFHKSNGGLSDARNFGMKQAKGIYLAFMDSDDYIDKTYYETLLQTAIETDADVVCTDIVYMYTTHQAVVAGAALQNVLSNQDETYTSHLLTTFPMAQNKLFKRSLIQQLHLEFPQGLLYEDVAFFYRLYPFLNTIAYVKGAGFYYRQREDSIMQNVTPRVLEIEQVLLGIQQWYDIHELSKIYQAELEYSFARHTLFASYGRILKSSDYTFIKAATRQHWQFVKTHYPHWRKNKYWKYAEFFRTKQQKLLYYGLTEWTYQLLVASLYLSKKIVAKQMVNQ